jgi:luciferase family oxidoreductase group 1
MPEGSHHPDLWLLGSSDQSAAYAAHFGFKFSFAQFIAGTSGAAVVNAYRENFRPSAFASEPKANLAISVVVADTEAEAQHLAKSRELWLLQAATGQRGTFPRPDEAESYPYTARERAFIHANRNRSVVGDPQKVKERLHELAAEYGVNEIVAVTICHDFAARLRSYELLAKAFELAPAAP